MAKLHKMEMYILDVNDYFADVGEAVDAVNSKWGCVSLHSFNVETVELYWHDDHVLNFSDAKYEDFRGMFDAKKT